MGWPGPAPTCLLAPETSLKEQPLRGTSCARGRGEWERDDQEAVVTFLLALDVLQGHLVSLAKAEFRVNNGMGDRLCLQEGTASPTPMDGCKILLQGKEEARATTNISSPKFKCYGENTAGREG